MQTIQLQNASFDDIVFEGKNKTYGAYLIRQRSNRATMTALGISVAIFLLAVFLPRIISALTPEEVIVNTGPVEVVTALDAPPPLDDATPPPPVDIPPPAKTIQFVAPKVEENVVEKEEVVLDVEEAKTTVTSTVTNEGPATVQIDLNQKVEVVVPDPPKVLSFVNVEQKPSFPGGDAAFFKYLGENINYPTFALESEIQGRVLVSFTISESGAITNARVVKGIGGGCDEEALRVIKTMPAWSPGKQNGRPVTVTHTLPVLFRLQ